MKVVRYGFPSSRRRIKQSEYKCKCGCDLSVWSQGSFRAGHSVRGRIKALKRTRFPLGKDKRKPVKKKDTEKHGFSRFGLV